MKKSEHILSRTYSKCTFITSLVKMLKNKSLNQPWWKFSNELFSLSSVSFESSFHFLFFFLNPFFYLAASTFCVFFYSLYFWSETKSHFSLTESIKCKSLTYKSRKHKSWITNRLNPFALKKKIRFVIWIAKNKGLLDLCKLFKQLKG